MTAPEETAAAALLIVEDRDSLRRLMQRALSGEGYRVTAAADCAAAEAALAATTFDLVLTDWQLPDGVGLDVLTASRTHQSEVPVVVITAYGTVANAVQAMKLGAVDFLEKPLELDELFDLVGGLVGERPSRAVFEVPGAPPILGAHPRMRAALRLLEKVAPTTSTVLLTGESGTGKELFARALHGLSARSGRFVAVNCAAIPDSLMENELFGHEKGAFTGAVRREEGRFELARGGTLFLDEIGELDLAVQGKVLRVLEERTYERVGSGRTLTTDARVVAATNRDLRQMTAAGTFREDLFFRLDVFPIELPPLRERASDVPPIAVHLVARIADRLGQPVPRLTAAAQRLLADQPWPGNVRQLANVLERAVILGGGEVVAADALEGMLAPPTADGSEASIRGALRETGGDKRRAAELLGVSYRTLQRKIREFDLEGFPKYRD